MHLSRFTAPATLLSILFLAATAPKSRTDGVAALAEVNRIRSHFDSVLSELAAHDLGTLNLAQRANRFYLTRTLRAYRDRGVFPHNYDFPNQFVPYFVDRKTGTLCAVGHLLASTGRQDIVYRVAQSDNNIYVAQLAGDTAFTRWLDVNGLTLDEAARIQVPYGMISGPSRSESLDNALAVAMPVAALGSLTVNIWNATANWDGHSRLGRYLGLGTGLLSAGVGASIASKPSGAGGVAAVMIGLGGVGLGLATHAITHHHGVLKAQRAATERNKTLQASLVPLVSTEGAGVMLAIRF